MMLVFVVDCTVVLQVRTLSDQAIEILVAWSGDRQVATADIIDGCVVDHERTVGVLERRVGSQDGVVWLNHGGGVVRSRVHAELELALLAVVDREALHQQSTEP